MGKTLPIVISSSDDEDYCTPQPSIRSTNRKSRSRRPVPRTPSRGQKKPRLSGSRSRLGSDSTAVDQIRFSCEDLEQEFNGFKVSTGQNTNGGQLWVDKYKPRSLEELAVHKKKVEEVKVWFEERFRYAKGISHSLVLVLVGPAGVGKSATVQLIASHLGARLCEWSTPTPTIWQEHVHSLNPGVLYTSKLDEFGNFIDRTRKYGLLPESIVGEIRSPIILLIDDLPMVNGIVAHERLKNCLHLLVQSTQIPTAILITDYGKVDSTDVATRSEDLLSFLERAGAHKVTFNPVTVNSIKKTLLKICRQEHCDVNAEQIDLIAKASGGDIRHAISSLQYFCLKAAPISCMPLYNRTPSCLKEESDKFHHMDDEFSLPFGRDETLTLFHALGKFLHNKRETENTSLSDQDGFLLKERLTRLPLKMDPPEKVLCQAHVQARPVTDFLHENVLDFLGEEAIGDAWAVASYLSDADSLLATLYGKVTRNFEIENLVQTVAASVAARGVLFGNSQPLPSRWHAVRRPKLWQVEQLSLRNKFEIMRQRSVQYMIMGAADPMVIATEFTPCLKWLGYRASEDSEAQEIEAEDENCDAINLDDRKRGDISEDEIEDC